MTWSTKRAPSGASRALLAVLCLMALATFWYADLQAGYWRPTEGSSSSFGWLLCSSTNTFCAVAFVVVVSTLLGGVLGLRRPRRAVETRVGALEWITTLPAVILTILGLRTTVGAPLATLAVVSAAHRTFQVAFLLRQASLARWHSRDDMGHTPPKQVSGQHRTLLCVSAAHSALLFYGEELALLMLGFLPASPPTWMSTLCRALRSNDVSAARVVVALLASAALPLALWHLGRGPGDRDSHPSRPLPLSLDRRL